MRQLTIDSSNFFNGKYLKPFISMHQTVIFMCLISEHKLKHQIIKWPGHKITDKREARYVGKQTKEKHHAISLSYAHKRYKGTQ